tara:strand:- start:276 stop:815 length:540 start_codon:yes stop_codon:yes gene_type:complete
MAIATATAATIAAGAAVVGAGATAIGAYQSWDAGRDAKKDIGKMKNLYAEQAEDIEDQIAAEGVIYEDELDMIRKQTQFAENKLLAGTGQGLDSLTDKIGESLDVVYGGSKYGGGSTERIKLGAKEAHEEGIRDIKDSYELGMEELALRDEEANRDALIRHEQIVGALEAQQKELEAMS